LASSLSANERRQLLDLLRRCAGALDDLGAERPAA